MKISRRFLACSLMLLTFKFGVFAEEEAPNVGWSKTANLGLNLSLTSSRDVVGQTDGTSQTYGLNLKSGWNLKREKDEWRNDVSYVGNTTKTPGVPRFVKSGDELRAASTYLHALESLPKIGPYAKAEAAAPVFKGEDVRSENKTYNVTRLNGTSYNQYGSSFRLTDGFKPLTTKESVGFFYKPLAKEKIKAETRAGLGALQIAAKHQHSVTGSNDAGEIVVKELDDVSQVGIELAANVKGKFSEHSAYEIGVETLTPIASNKDDDDDREAIRLTNVDAFAKLSSNLTNWASMGYDYKLKIQPQLVDRTQQTHMFVLNINYNLF